MNLLSSPSPVPNPSPKSRSNPSPKSKIQSPKERDWDWGWHYNPTGHPTTTTHNFSHMKHQSSDGKRPPMTFHDLLWPSMTFYHLLRPLLPSMIKCLLSRPSLIAGLLHSTPLQINSQSIPRLDLIDSKSSFKIFLIRIPPCSILSFKQVLYIRDLKGDIKNLLLILF